MENLALEWLHLVCSCSFVWSWSLSPPAGQWGKTSTMIISLPVVVISAFSTLRLFYFCHCFEEDLHIALTSSFSASDELKHIIGADTTRKGILRVFEMFQYQPMNRRLVYVFLEGFLETMFPQYKFPELFVKLHSRSPRIHRYNQKLKCASLKRWQQRTEATGHRPTKNTQTWELWVRVWALTWKSRYIRVQFLPFHFPHSLAAKTLQLSSCFFCFWFFFFLSRRNWRMSNTHTNSVICTKLKHGISFPPSLLTFSCV